MKESMFQSNYDKFPVVEVPGFASECWRGWSAVLSELRATISTLR